MATEAFGLPFEIGTLSAWLVWILPFAAAMIIFDTHSHIF